MAQVKPVVIEFHTTELQINEGVSQRTGKPYKIIKQLAYAFIGGAPYPEKIEISLDEGQPPFNIGKYYVDMNACVSVDRFGSLGLDQRSMKLHPATEKVSG